MTLDTKHRDVPASVENPGPAGTSGDGAEHLQRIIAARAGVDTANAELRLAVRAAREVGDSWAMIAAALDTSRRSAVQRFCQRRPRR
jgi:hypothetical protein